MMNEAKGLPGFELSIEFICLALAQQPVPTNALFKVAFMGYMISAATAKDAEKRTMPLAPLAMVLWEME